MIDILGETPQARRFSRMVRHCVPRALGNGAAAG
jgi:hypothetical protein